MFWKEKMIHRNIRVSWGFGTIDWLRADVKDKGKLVKWNYFRFWSVFWDRLLFCKYSLLCQIQIVYIPLIFVCLLHLISKIRKNNQKEGFNQVPEIEHLFLCCYFEVTAIIVSICICIFTFTYVGWVLFWVNGEEGFLNMWLITKATLYVIYIL